MSALKHWWPVIRGSIIGTIVGIILGVGGPTAVFVAYAHARQTSKDPESFGKGNIEGVIAPESANNAKDGGALIPTIAFGIPGSTVMAILLAALYMHGLEPGRALVMNNQTFLFSLVWLIVLGGILGSVFGLAGTTFLAKITNVSYKIVVPAIIIVSALGTIVYRNLFSDLMIAGFFGIVGYIMKKLGYPTSTLIIGFVLGNKIEKSLFVSTELYGAAFLTRPLVVVMLVLLVVLLVWPAISRMRKKHKQGATARGMREGRQPMATQKTLKISGNLVFLAVVEVLFIYLGWKTLGYSFRPALMPGIMVGGILVCSTILLAREIRATVRRARGTAVGKEKEPELSPEEAAAAKAARKADRNKVLEMAAWLVGLVVLVYLLGMLIAIPVFLLAFMLIRSRVVWWKALTITAGIEIGVYLIFVMWLNTILYEGLIATLWVPH